jgi:hypothetical protein
MGEFFAKILAWIESTHIQEQVATVDFVGLFSNPWFLGPFILAVLYLLYKQAVRDLVVLSVFVAVWWVSGTNYMHTLVVGDELQLDKILPVLFGGAALLGFLIYLFFGRSD